MPYAIKENSNNEGTIWVKKIPWKTALCLSLCVAMILSSSACRTVKQTSTDAEGVRLPVVMYHHLTTDAGYANDYTLLVEQFEQDLKYIQQQGYQTISLSQLIDFQNGQGELPEKPIMITFDDGFESFEVYAVPLLKHYGMQAVLAVVGEYADLFTEHIDHNVAYSYLSWEGIADTMLEGNVEIISHTYSMHSTDTARKGCKQMSGESDEAYRAALTQDLQKLQDTLVDYTGQAPRAIAFPYGHYNTKTLEIVRGMGFEVAFTCRERINIVGLQDETFLLLGRYNRPSGKSSAAFFRPLMEK